MVEKERVKERFTEHFEGLLNVEEDREAEMFGVGWENGVNVIVVLNNTGHERRSSRGGQITCEEQCGLRKKCRVVWIRCLLREV